MNKNFKVRVIVGTIMLVVSIIALYTFNAVPFKIIFCLFSIIALIELTSFFRHKHKPIGTVLACFETLFIVCGVIFVALASPRVFWYVLLGVPGYDIFAYLFGMTLGGKIFGDSRPFIKVSKNKTWEGTILGLTTATGMVLTVILLCGKLQVDWPFLFCGPLALVGDLFESFLKRKFTIKDSNEILIKNSFFEKVELLVGGSEGHGGFLDRIDSIAFATTVLLLLALTRGIYL
ncbi:MAG: phosphatidate cytidylyltransferase [Candidatus Saccharibacteria bacterium]|nr:phosphatidate cytidylyltransferase [Candidatus Saccharibacteria bacterium]